MELLIGRLPRKETVTVTSHLITELEPFINNNWILRIPANIGPRWSMIKQQDINYHNFPCKWSFDVEIKNSYTILDYKCVHHELQLVVN